MSILLIRAHCVLHIYWLGIIDYFQMIVNSFIAHKNVTWKHENNTRILVECRDSGRGIKRGSIIIYFTTFCDIPMIVSNVAQMQPLYTLFYKWTKSSIEIKSRAPCHLGCVQCLEYDSSIFILHRGEIEDLLLQTVAHKLIYSTKTRISSLIKLPSKIPYFFFLFSIAAIVVEFKFRKNIPKMK